MTLALGYKTVAHLENEMSVEEFMGWGRYNARHLMPMRRLEFYIAQLTLQVSQLGQLWGGPKFTFQDFLFDERLDKQPKQTTVEEGAEALSSISGGVKVVKLGQRRKRG